MNRSRINKFRCWVSTSLIWTWWWICAQVTRSGKLFVQCLGVVSCNVLVFWWISVSKRWNIVIAKICWTRKTFVSLVWVKWIAWCWCVLISVNSASQGDEISSVGQLFPDLSVTDIILTGLKYSLDFKFDSCSMSHALKTSVMVIALSSAERLLRQFSVPLEMISLPSCPRKNEYSHSKQVLNFLWLEFLWFASVQTMVVRTVIKIEMRNFYTDFGTRGPWHGQDEKNAFTKTSENIFINF